MKSAEKGRVLIALGGNAILKHTERGTAEEQMRNVRITTKRLVEIIREGHRIAITHGNGPQVGFIARRSDIAHRVEGMHEVPLDVCGADTQGAIGYEL